MAVLSFQRDGADDFRAMLERFGDNVRDMEPAFEKMADYQAKVWSKNFGSEGGYNTGGWSPLSPDYGAWKAKNYPGRGILELTGDLKDSLAKRPFGVEVINDHQMIIGTAVDYARYHQDGTSNMPARPVIGDTRREDIKAFTKFMHAHIFEMEAI